MSQVTIAPYEDSDPGDNHEGFFENLEKKGNHWHSGQNFFETARSEVLSGRKTGRKTFLARLRIVWTIFKNSLGNSSGNTPKIDITAKYLLQIIFN